MLSSVINEHVFGPDVAGACYYCGRQTMNRCFTCTDKKYVCLSDACLDWHSREYHTGVQITGAA
jgi:hypothetical protein